MFDLFCSGVLGWIWLGFFEFLILNLMMMILVLSFFCCYCLLLLSMVLFELEFL